MPQPEREIVDHQVFVDRARLSPLWWFGVFCQILDKLRNQVIPNPNIAQIRLFEAYEDAMTRGVPFRCIMVKPRKVGISTAAVALAYWHMRVMKAFAAIMADTLDRSDALFDVLKYIAEHDQMPWNDGIVLSITDDLISFGAGEGSSQAAKYTAERPAGTRGETPQIVIATEAAFYPIGGVRDATETMTGLLNSVPKLPGTLVIIESTAKGFAGFFPAKWKLAHWPRFCEPQDQYWKKFLDGQNEGDSDYTRVFVAWWEMEEYKLPVTAMEIAVMKAHLSPEEVKGIHSYGWTWEQVAWRRNTIKNECENSETKFKEEYPSSPDEPFTVSGSPRFDVNGLNYLQQLADHESDKGGLLSDIDPVRGGRPTFVPTAENEAWFKVWEFPKVGCRYFCGGDVAEDKDMNPASASNEVKRDRHAFFVVRAGYTDDHGVRWRPKLVARIHPNRDGHDLLAKRIWLMSLFYGNCPIAPEMNNHGLALAKALKALGANLFTQTIVDPLNGAKSTSYGFRTNERTRPELLEAMATSIRNVIPTKDELDGTSIINPDALEIPDAHVVSQLRTFIVDRSGKAEASPGNHDDDVLGLAITFFLLAGATAYTEKIVERVIPKWDYQIAQDPRKRVSITGS